MRMQMFPTYLSSFAITVSIFLLACGLAVKTVHGQAIPSDLSVELIAGDIVSISLPKQTERGAFDFDGGQFQILIPKGRFPVPAPNCKKNVIFRMAGVSHEDPSRTAKLDARWDLFQSLYAVKEGKKESILVRVASGPYMKTRKDGTRVLEYCNAFIKLE